MGDEPRNAASAAGKVFLQVWGDRERVLAEARSWFAESFVREDRRRLIAMPNADVSAYLEQHLVWFEISDEVPTFELAETIAVRGERFVSGRLRVRYGPEFAAEMLFVIQWDEGVRQLQKMVIFDSDDVEAATDELDRLRLALQDEEATR